MYDFQNISNHLCFEMKKHYFNLLVFIQDNCIINLQIMESLNNIRTKILSNLFLKNNRCACLWGKSN